MKLVMCHIMDSPSGKRKLMWIYPYVDAQFWGTVYARRLYRNLEEMFKLLIHHFENKMWSNISRKRETVLRDV